MLDYNYLAGTMQNRSNILLLFIALWFVSACCKEEINGTETVDIFEHLTQYNQLPYHLPVISNQSDGDQTKGLFFYDKNSMDVVFRSIGVADANTNNTKLWVQILNPDIRVFADTRIDSFYSDSVYIDGVQMIEIHNRANGNNFYKLDTALLALPFSYEELDTKRPNLFDQTVVTVHVQFNERIDSMKINYNVERGVLKRKLRDFVGFKNIKDGRVFFVELTDRYVLKSIEVRKD